MPQCNKNLLIQLLQTAINKCYESDYCLIERDMERASVSRIFLYINKLIQEDSRFEEFKEYDLDCEYNKNSKYMKKTPRCPRGASPDLILHKQNSNQNNLLVVEFKSATGRFRYYDKITCKTKDKKENETDKEIDFVKLEDFTNEWIYNYSLGVFVRLKHKSAEYKYFQGGRKIKINLASTQLNNN